MERARKEGSLTELKPLRKRLEEVSRKTSLRLDVVQQDYVLSWLLVGIFQHPELRPMLIFKGGTALKKGFFGEYRFSEDLDFSTRGVTPENFFPMIQEATQSAEVQMREFAPVQLTAKKYEEKTPHPDGQQAFTISAQFPWQSQPLTTAMIEISCNEQVLLQPIEKPLLHSYGEQIELQMNLYSLEEIIMEKLRAILQHTKKLHERDWSRSRARDYYDLWRIFETFNDQIDWGVINANLVLKCAHKEVWFNSFADFFDDKMIQLVSRTWDRWLSPLVPELPNCYAVIEELRTKLSSLPFDRSSHFFPRRCGV